MNDQCKVSTCKSAASSLCLWWQVCACAVRPCDQVARIVHIEVGVTPARDVVEIRRVLRRPLLGSGRARPLRQPRVLMKRCQKSECTQGHRHFGRVGRSFRPKCIQKLKCLFFCVKVCLKRCEASCLEITFLPSHQHQSGPRRGISAPRSHKQAESLLMVPVQCT